MKDQTEAHPHHNARDDSDATAVGIVTDADVDADKEEATGIAITSNKVERSQTFTATAPLPPPISRDSVAARLSHALRVSTRVASRSIACFNLGWCLRGVRSGFRKLWRLSCGVHA